MRIAQDVLTKNPKACRKTGSPPCPKERVKADSGPAFLSRTLDARAKANKVRPDDSRPGAPTGHLQFESFNGSFLDECLNRNSFFYLRRTPKAKSSAGGRDYNEFRPHRAVFCPMPADSPESRI